MSDPFQVPNRTFKKLFRLNKETARALITMTAEHLQEGLIFPPNSILFESK